MSFKFNPLTGNLDLVGDQQTASASIDFTRTCGQTISALKLVTSDTDNRIIYAESGDTFEKSQVLGLALDAGAEDDLISVRAFGLVADPFFAFAAGVNLYLGASGVITDTPPSTGFRVLVGKSLGIGEVFIDVSETIILEA